MIRSRTSCILMFFLMLCLAHGATAERVVGMSKVIYDQISEVQDLFDQDEWQMGLEALEVLGGAQAD